MDQAGNRLGGFSDGEWLTCANIENSSGLPPDEKVPKTYGQIGGMEVGANRVAVAMNGDRAEGEDVTEKVADCELPVEQEAGADKGKPSCDG